MTKVKQKEEKIKKPARKRFIIEKCKTGVAVWDNVNQFYIIDASTIEKNKEFTICKRGVKRRKQFKWEMKIEYSVED